MVAKKQPSAQYESQGIERIERGDYEAQRQLDFRLVHGETLRIVSALDLSSGEERDFQIAMKRRKEPAGASLTELGKKYRL
jgi:hypothetical protein